MVYRTLNNATARRVILHAIECDYRSCAYALYNFRDVFASEPYDRLFHIVIELLGPYLDEIFFDASISFEVKYFIRTYSKKP